MTNYPDIDNSILLFPDRWNSNNSHYLATINGLDFCMLGGICSKDDLINLKQYVYNYSYCPMLGVYNANYPNTDRITTVNTLSQLVGATIGKTIVLPDLIIQLSLFTPGITEVFKMNVGVFHSDGTISYLAQNISYIGQYSYSRMPYSASNWSKRGANSVTAESAIKVLPQTKIISTDGIIIQEGDRVYAEITNKTSDTASKPISFGGLNACFPDDRLQPIQFSID